ncbi:TATA-box-binding protein [Haloarcula virus HJTV-2]|uniref:TATA-box-binding protein n=1 Tax=Haloarcula virus HJTV-2 TaxID=2877986 RepID=A0AAE8XWA1_9CAUD|nr:TATA-box-binding protein [Haloarcula virus HJTV-2]UBF21661.1 TATA-box-binding protein [Haloarcula virus HJTV-2]
MSGDSEIESLPDIEVANIVASGKLNLELDLAAVAEDLRELDIIEDVEHSRRQGNRLLIHFREGEALGILAPTGVYVFTGVDTHEEIHSAKEQLFSALASLGIISGVDVDESEVVDEFQVQNVVCTAELSDHLNLNLNALAIGLGLENTEYEPEQFPGLIFRPSSSSCTILIFASGKVVITGVREADTAQTEFVELREKLESLLG